jgi:hypothetical protein
MAPLNRRFRVLAELAVDLKAKTNNAASAIRSLLIYDEADLLQLPTRKILRTSGQDGSHGKEQTNGSRVCHPGQSQFHAHQYPAAQLLG